MMQLESIQRIQSSCGTKTLKEAKTAALKQNKPKRKTKEEHHEDALEQKRIYMRQYKARMKANK